MDLDEWRSRINNLDGQILNLLNQRAEAALKIGDLKRHSGAPVYAPEREAEVFRRGTDAHAGRSHAPGNRCGSLPPNARRPAAQARGGGCREEP